MGIFTSKEKPQSVFQVPAFDEPEAAVNYNSVLDYLVGLGDDDFEKIKKVANIYRKANKDASEALGVENEPSAFISNPELDELQTLPPVPISPDEAIIDAFLEQEIATPTAKAKKKKSE